MSNPFYDPFTPHYYFPSAPPAPPYVPSNNVEWILKDIRLRELEEDRVKLLALVQALTQRVKELNGKST